MLLNQLPPKHGLAGLKRQLVEAKANELAETRRRWTALTGRCHAPPQALKKGGANGRDSAASGCTPSCENGRSCRTSPSRKR